MKYFIISLIVVVVGIIIYLIAKNPAPAVIYPCSVAKEVYKNDRYTPETEYRICNQDE